MRLIDADAFKKYIRDACNEMSHVYKDGGKWAKQITEDFCMDIDEQPTIEERKTGKWIDAVIPNDNGGLPVQVCDQCNTFFPLAYTGGGHSFCPNCGADMRGEAE